MKYKVGDKVRVRGDLAIGRLYGGRYSFDGEMVNFLGKEIVIDSVWADGSGYTIKGSVYTWTGEMLEPVETKLKAYDVMKLAAENPGEYEGKRYRVVEGSTMVAGGTNLQLVRKCIIRNAGFETIESPHYGLAAYNDTILEEIKPEPQPVSFMEAVKAYSEGKTVECKIDCITYIYKKEDEDGDPLCEMQAEETKAGLSAREILHGVWYIKQ
jgi:hypothetical protein